MSDAERDHEIAERVRACYMEELRTLPIFARRPIWNKRFLEDLLGVGDGSGLWSHGYGIEGSCPALPSEKPNERTLNRLSP